MATLIKSDTCYLNLGYSIRKVPLIMNNTLNVPKISYMTLSVTPKLCILLLYPEWQHRQGGCLACWRLQSCKIESRLWLSRTDLYYARGGHWVLPMNVGGVTSQLDLPSLTTIVRSWLWSLQLGVPHWATSVDYCK